MFTGLLSCFLVLILHASTDQDDDVPVAIPHASSWQLTSTDQPHGQKESSGIDTDALLVCPQ